MKTFTQEFQERVDGIKSRCKAANVTMSEICKKAKIARATPDRWAQRAPLSVRLIDKMEATLDKIEQGN